MTDSTSAVPVVVIDEHGQIRCKGCKDYTFKSITGPWDCPNCGQPLLVVRSHETPEALPNELCLE
jgi:ribosomal protein L37AE/L43A